MYRVLSKSVLQIFIFLALLTSLLGSAVFVTPAHAAGIIVNNNVDIIADDGVCTLQEAIYNANIDTKLYATPGECDTGSGTDTITFNAGLSGQTIYLGSPLTITSDMTIDDSGLASQVTIDGSTSTQVFEVNGGTVTLNRLKIMNGSALNGGGIFNNAGATLTISNSTLSGNSAQAGGSVYNLGLLTITNSTFSGNSAPDGGGIYNDSTTLTVTNSTFSGNSAGGNGGGIYTFGGTLTLTNSTFSGNSAGTSGGGVYYNGGTLNYANTIIANSSGGDCAGSGAISTNINNLVEDNTCSPALHVDPLLDSLKDNSGPTQTMALMLTSPAIDAGEDTVCDDNPGPNNFDQRGVVRPVGAHCDIGAYEGAVDLTAPSVDSFTVPASSTSLTISPITLGASDNNSPVTAYLITESATPPAANDAGWMASSPTNYTTTGGGSYTLYPWAKDSTGNVSALYNPPASVTVCGSTSDITVANTNDSGPGSLRQALADGCAGITIDFNASLSGQTILVTSQLEILKNFTIDGSDLTSKITISGGSTTRVFLVASGVTATLDSLIVTHGRVEGCCGAGLLNYGTLTITNSLFSANINNNGTGGAIMNIAPGTLTLTGSTISGNSASTGGGIGNENQMTITNSTFSANSSGDAGGGIHNSGATATLTVTNSTFSGNTASTNGFGSGGGIYSNAPLTVRNSTFSGNSAAYDAGGIAQDSGTLNISNTIIANSVGGDCYRSSATGVNLKNLVEDGSCANTPHDPNLGPLADNGGTTQTFALLANSLAIDAGDDATCATPEVNNLDQHGIARPNGGHCDIGAVEYVDTTAPTITVFNVPASPTVLNIPITFTASDDAALTGYLITESNTPPLVSNTHWTASPPTTYPVPSMGFYTLYPWAKDAAGHVSAVYGSGVTANITCLDAITVTSNANSGAGSLRQTISDTCDGGTINFNASLSGDTIHLDSPLDISKSLTINGAAATPITISGDSGPTPDGTGDVRVFHTTASTFTTVTLNSLMITKGLASGPHNPNRDDEGGGLLAEIHTTVNIINSTFSGNSAANGGAISVYGTVNISDSTFSDNLSTNGAGGGGAILNSQILTIENSTFSNNTADNSGGGGALFNTSPNATITNSTFFGNIAALGGAITTTSDLTITNSTISGNSAYGGSGGGLTIQGHTTNLINTIIANSITRIGGSGLAGDCFNTATIGTNLNNLIEDGSCSANSTGFHTGDPGLATALANNSGLTQTLALLAGSHAIDAGDDASCVASPVNNLDQRGTTRLNGSHCDIGAYEYVDVTAPSVTTFTAPSLTKNLNIPITAFTASDDAVVAGYLITGNATPPLAGAAGWSSSAPTTYTVVSGGSYLLYPWVKDATGHVSLAHASVNVMVDTTAPTVVSSLRPNGSANPSASVSVNFTVTFFESVTGVSASDFSLTTTGTVTGAAVTAVSGSGAVRTVSVNTGSGDGTIRLNVPVTATITDIAGNAISGLPYISGQAYIISKTLTFASTAAQDGWVLESFFTSERGGTLDSQATTFNLGDDATKKQYRGILSFNTSSIPDNATITGVTLKVKKSAIVGGGNPVSIFQGFMADIKNGFFGTLALQTTDFQTIGTASYGPFLLVAPVSNVYSINLTGGKLNINKLTANSGLTQIRLRFKLGDNNNTVANTLILFSGNATSAADRPKLVITYSTP